MLVLGLLCCEFVTFAQLGVPEVKVFAGDGVLVFRHAAIISGPRGCQFKSFVENLSDSAYGHLELKATINSGTVRVEFPMERFPIGAKGTQLLSVKCPIGTPARGALSLSYVRGLTLLPKSKNANQSNLVTQYLWSLPIAKSSLEVVLLGKDRGCATNYGKAVDKGGLEGRIALPELESNGCGSFIQSDSWVRVLEDGSDFVLVEEGDLGLQSPKGWIQRRFLTPPEAFSPDAAIRRAMRNRADSGESARSSPFSKSPAAILKPQARSWDVVSLDSRITESNDVWSRLAWKLRIANRSATPVKLAGEIVFEDADGFIVDSQAVSDLVVGPDSEEVFTGAALINAASVGKVKGLKAKIAPAR